MEPHRYSYSPIIARPRIVWPGGARVALWIVPNIEHYEYLPAYVRTRNPWPRSPYPDVLGYGTRDYGNRVGIWRMFEIMDRYDFRCTVSLSLSVYEHYPEIREAIEARRWAIMSHGVYNTRYHWDLSEEEERQQIAEAAAIYKHTTGRTLAGWFSPAVSFTKNTPDLVAEAGIRYICDFYHDDQPTPIKVRNGAQLISVPYSMDLNDALIYRQPVEAEEFAEMVMDHFDTVWREGAVQGRVMCIALHPYMITAPHRAKHLDRALKYMLSHGGVWKATGEEIADWYIAHALEPYRRHLGEEA
jgi:peptidoglycan/xylan/chitin deacetylase (PgdA/CDA1 family)